MLLAYKHSDCFREQKLPTCCSQVQNAKSAKCKVQNAKITYLLAWATPPALAPPELGGV